MAGPLGRSFVPGTQGAPRDALLKVILPAFSGSGLERAGGVNACGADRKPLFLHFANLYQLTMEMQHGHRYAGRGGGDWLRLWKKKGYQS